MKKLFLSFVMLMSCCMMFSQNEFEFITDGVDVSEYENVIDYYDILEMDNGDFVMFGSKSSKNYFGRFSKTGELISETLRYDYLPGYNIINYEGRHIKNADDGGFYVFTVYNPILDTSKVNYQACFDSKIIMEKLDENFEYVYHKEMSIYIDTTNWLNIWAHQSHSVSPPEIQLGTVMDKGDGFVICYEKYAGHDISGEHVLGYDTTVIIKTDYDLNIEKSGSFGHELCNKLRHRNHLLYDEEDDEYLYYVSGRWPEEYRRGLYLYRFDSDFNFIDDHLLWATEGLSAKAIYYRDHLYSVTSGITLKRTSTNKTIMMAGADDHHIPYGHYTDAICLLMNDEAKMLDSITFAKVESASGNSTSVPSMCSVDWVDEDRIFTGATPYMYHSVQMHNSRQQYFIIKMINKDLTVLDERYYDLGETTGLCTHILKATNDGGCMIAGHFKDFGKDPDIYYNVIKKFPPEAFVGIEEPHNHGLKLAVAYPNPGGDVMNIRTTLRDCNLTVYDMQGRIVHQQEITDDVTSVDASNWSSGTYIWELKTENGKLKIEEGKWVK